ncbi:MAG: TIGR04076 family protein [Vicinamibacteria bacterium]
MSEDRFQLYDLRVTVVEIRGRSVCGLSVGDWFEVRNSSQLVLPPGRHFCIYALASALPLLSAKQRKLSENDWLESDSVVACPDPDEQLIMRIERLAPVELRKSDLT